MKKFITFALITTMICSCLGMTACDQVKDISSVDDVKTMAQSWGNTAKDWADAGIANIKDSAMKQINSEVDKFMEENNIPKDKADEVMKLAKEWAKTALTASGEIDKAKGSLKQYLSDHLDDLDVSEDESN